MTDEHRISELKHELASLHQQTSNQYLLLREISSILNTVSSTLTSANQISAHERESLISRLESIDHEINHERRVLSETLARIERSVDSLETEFDSFAKDRDEADSQLAASARNIDAILLQLQAIAPNTLETVKHARKMVDRDPDTGAQIPRMDKIIKTLATVFWSAVAAAVILMGISAMVPWIKGVRISNTP